MGRLRRFALSIYLAAGFPAGKVELILSIILAFFEVLRLIFFGGKAKSITFVTFVVSKQVDYH